MLDPTIADEPAPEPTALDIPHPRGGPGRDAGRGRSRGWRPSTAARRSPSGSRADDGRRSWTRAIGAGARQRSGRGPGGMTAAGHGRCRRRDAGGSPTRRPPRRRWPSCSGSDAAGYLEQLDGRRPRTGRVLDAELDERRARGARDRDRRRDAARAVHDRGRRADGGHGHRRRDVPHRRRATSPRPSRSQGGRPALALGQRHRGRHASSTSTRDRRGREPDARRIITSPATTRRTARTCERHVPAARPGIAVLYDPASELVHVLGPTPGRRGHAPST